MGFRAPNNHLPACSERTIEGTLWSHRLIDGAPQARFSHKSVPEAHSQSSGVTYAYCQSTRRHGTRSKPAKPYTVALRKV